VKSATTAWMRLKLSALSHGTFGILNQLYSPKTTASNLSIFVSFGHISPKALLLHLKRFIVEDKINSSHGAKSDENSHPNNLQAKGPSYEFEFKKNMAPVAIPVKLSLDAFRVDSDDKQDQTSASASSPSAEYSLRSAVHHIGSSASSGHYTADAIRLCEKDRELGDTTTANTGTEKEMVEEWVNFDDGNSAWTTLETVTNFHRKSSVYMLLYALKEDNNFGASIVQAVPAPGAEQADEDDNDEQTNEAVVYGLPTRPPLTPISAEKTAKRSANLTNTMPLPALANDNRKQAPDTGPDPKEGVFIKLQDLYATGDITLLQEADVQEHIKVSSNLPEPKLNPVSCNPIVLESLTLVIDPHIDSTTDKIVNEESFADECRKISSSDETLLEMIHKVALSMNFTLVDKHANWNYFYEHDSNGQSFAKNSLKRGLKSRLTVLAAHPGCKSLMVILLIAFP
jgi:hypothetical protein